MTKHKPQAKKKSVKAITGNSGARTYSSIDALKQDPSFQSWIKSGYKLGAAGQNQNFIFGDWLNEGLGAFNLDEEKAHVQKGTLLRWGAQATRLSESTVQLYATVAAKIPEERRKINQISFTHHRAVADAAPADQTRYLQLAIKNKWSVSKLNQHLIDDEVIAKKPKIGYSAAIDAANTIKRLERLIPNTYTNISIAAIAKPKEFETLHDKLQSTINRLMDWEAHLGDAIDPTRKGAAERNAARLYSAGFRPKVSYRADNGQVIRSEKDHTGSTATRTVSREEGLRNGVTEEDLRASLGIKSSKEPELVGKN